MVGRKFFNGLVKEFQDFVRVLSCHKNIQLSPTHSNVSLPEIERKGRKSLETISEIVINEAMGNKQGKVSEFDHSIQQDRVLDILREETTTKSKSNFSPFTPLPAIGTLSLDDSESSRIIRQNTYRVLDPVYIRGPLDIYDFMPVRGSTVLKDVTLNESSVNVLQSEKKSTKEHTPSVVQVNSCRGHVSTFNKKNISKSAQKKLQQITNIKKFDKENATSFWVDF